MAFMMNKLAMINSCEIILEKKFAKNHCEIQVCAILVCALYSIKYGTHNNLARKKKNCRWEKHSSLL
jgi:hypothetical protein